MPNGIPTPYDDRIQDLQKKLKKHPGRDGAQAKLQKQKTKAFYYNQNRESPIPYSGAYDSTVAGLNQDFSNSQADLAGQRLATEQQFGFGADKSNPFSVARQLERQYGQRTAGTNNSYAASGQLYAGSLSNAKREDRYQHEQATDQQIREYQSRLAEISSRGRDLQADYDQGVLDAEAKRLEDGLSQPVDPTEAAGPPKFARQYVKSQQQRIKTLEKKGKENKADALRDKLKKLRG